MARWSADRSTVTPNQQQLYFRAWGACAKARGWTTADGRAADRAFFAAAPEIAQLHEQVWAWADGLAQQHGRDVTADHLCHACHGVALGVDKSSKLFTNAELDRVLALFAVLTDPDDLTAVIELSRMTRPARSSDCCGRFGTWPRSPTRARLPPTVSGRKTGNACRWKACASSP